VFFFRFWLAELIALLMGLFFLLGVVVAKLSWSACCARGQGGLAIPLLLLYRDGGAGILRD